MYVPVKATNIAQDRSHDGGAAREQPFPADSCARRSGAREIRTRRVATTRARPTLRLVTIAAVLAGAALLSAGCGASHPSKPAVGPPATFTAAALDYAKCMRDHGVPHFPNPTLTDHNGQAVTYIAPPNSVLTSPAYTSANKTCARILPLPIAASDPEPQAGSHGLP